MRAFAVAAACLLLLLSTGCEYTRTVKRTVTQLPDGRRKVDVDVHVVRTRCRKAQPCIDNPIEQRYRNPDGSCVHVSFATVLANQGKDELADWWADRYHGGEGAGGLRSKAIANNIPFSDTTDGSVQWVDWAMRTGRGCVVNDRPGHVRTLVGLDPATVPNAKAYVLDNNGPPTRIHTYGRDEWIRMWQNRGGWAATAVYNPNPVRTWN